MVDTVPKVSIRRDPRFDLKIDWEQVVVPAIAEAQSRGVLVTPLTVFQDGRIVGWFLHGWVAPPAIISYKCDPPSNYVPNYSI